MNEIDVFIWLRLLIESVYDGLLFNGVFERSQYVRGWDSHFLYTRLCGEERKDVDRHGDDETVFAPIYRSQLWCLSKMRVYSRRTAKNEPFFFIDETLLRVSCHVLTRLAKINFFFFVERQRPKIKFNMIIIKYNYPPPKLSRVPIKSWNLLGIDCCFVLGNFP